MTAAAPSPSSAAGEPPASDPLAGRRATGIGSWPGVDPLEAARVTFGELGGAPGLPYQPELPARGPGTEMIGRGAAMLAELPVDLQPSGWRLVDRPGRDLQRAQAGWRQDCDALAEVAHAYTGPLKVQLVGPWTLLASVALSRGERAVADPGARRDVVASLAEGVHAMVADVARAVPGARIVFQVDEPNVPAVLAGRLPTQSGMGRIRAVPAHEIQESLSLVAAAARGAGAHHVVAHCCAADVPIALLRAAGLDGISVDTTLLGPKGWESVAVSVEAGLRVWAGIDAAGAAEPSATGQMPLVRWWREVGLPVASLGDVVLTPTCGLAAASPAEAAQAIATVTRRARELAEWVGEES